jgi:hypothetical protein
MLALRLLSLASNPQGTPTVSGRLFRLRKPFNLTYGEQYLTNHGIVVHPPVPLVHLLPLELLGCPGISLRFSVALSDLRASQLTKRAGNSCEPELQMAFPL